MFGVLVAAAGLLLAARPCEARRETPSGKLMLPNYEAPLINYYIYRAASDEYPAVDSEWQRSQNFANAAGVLRYVHNEVVGRNVVGSAQPPVCERKYNISRIIRYKVLMRSTREAMARQDSGFLGFVAIDQAKCTVPQCKEIWWDKYGYVPGCQEQDPESFFYSEAVWYSFPGRCPQQTYSVPCPEEREAELGEGGACRPTRMPDGNWSCTYTYEPTGSVTLDELAGITEKYKNFREFCMAGGVEFNGPRDDDSGVTIPFWKDYKSMEANKRRVRAMLALFKAKYPENPALEDPSCTGPQPPSVLAPAEAPTPAPSTTSDLPKPVPDEVPSSPTKAPAPSNAKYWALGLVGMGVLAGVLAAVGLYLRQPPAEA